ncbi:MAG: hypothetical protein QJR09_08020 [Micrococcus sp.]|nr:hypothetical protein [Micrococcus sp.]
MIRPRIHTVSGSTPDGTLITIEAGPNQQGRVVVTANGAEVMVGTTFLHETTPHFWPGPTGGLAFSPTTLRLLADLIEQAHQEN